MDNSQCETIYDGEEEEATEAVEGAEEEEGAEEAEEDQEGGLMSDGWEFRITSEDAVSSDEEATPAVLSPETQWFVDQNPAVSEQFRILSKIGEGKPHLNVSF